MNRKMWFFDPPLGRQKSKWHNKPRW